MENPPSTPPPTGQSGMAWAMRMSTELVVAILIGLGMGYGLDQWLGTSPWLMLLFFVFGAIAGFLNVFRMANPTATGYPFAVTPPREQEKKE